MFRRKVEHADAKAQPDAEAGNGVGSSARPSSSTKESPFSNNEKAVSAISNGLHPLAPGKKSTRGVSAEGESGRRFFHPLKFFWICFRSSSRLSMAVNILWPLLPPAIVTHFVYHDGGEHYILIFVLNYLALIPCANLLGFAGQELARKLPKVWGVLLETTLGSVTELILFTVLVVFASHDKFETGFSVVKAAILGSILANMLLCLGACFIAGGIHHHEQVFHEVVSEVGSGLILVAGIGLVAPTIFSTIFTNIQPQTEQGCLPIPYQQGLVEKVSRATAIILLIAFIVYVLFQTTSHHGLYDEVLESDEQNDRDRHKDLAKPKLTFTECIVAILIGIAGVALTAVFLVQEIDRIVIERHVSDAFMGLILVPLVEKAAEHLTAVDEAYDNQSNFALAHVLGASIQTALLNAPLAVIIGWGIKSDLLLPNVAGIASSVEHFCHMDLNFHTFEAVVLILAIIVVGNFLRDGKSNYLEGVLCILVYVIIAVCAFYYMPHEEEAGGEAAGAEGGAASGEATGGEVAGEPTAEGSAAAVATEAAKLLIRATFRS